MRLSLLPLLREPDGDLTRRIEPLKELRMEAVLRLPMEDRETKEQAEDRLIDLMEKSGVKLVGGMGETTIETLEESEDEEE